MVLNKCGSSVCKTKESAVMQHVSRQTYHAIEVHRSLSVFMHSVITVLFWLIGENGPPVGP